MRVILHADDFGASDETVRATIECIEGGALTSASIMPGMPATAKAIAFAREHPELDFGVHLTFVGDGSERPLSPPAEIASLVKPDGRFRSTRELRLRSLLSLLPAAQVELELSRQLEAVADEGVEITHVDSHRHMHKLPSFRKALERVLPRFGIRRVRAVQDVYLRRPLGSPTYWLGPGWQRRLARSFVTTDHLYMPTSTRDVGWERPLVAALRRLRGTTLELGVHPGFDDWRDGERRSLLAFAAMAGDAGLDLVAWRDLRE
jgi:hypothetical protein